MKSIMKLGIFIGLVSFLTLSACQKEEKLEAPASVSSTQKAKATFTYTAHLNPLNGSGVTGVASLTLEGNKLTVDIMATGLDTNKVHAQHIHGNTSNKRNSICPPASADTSGDGYISVGEGLPFYGPVILALQNFPTADSTGTINYSETFMLVGNNMPSLGMLQPLVNRSIVLHGMTVNGTYEPSLPVACEQLMITSVTPNPQPPSHANNK